MVWVFHELSVLGIGGKISDQCNLLIVLFQLVISVDIFGSGTSVRCEGFLLQSR